MKKCPHFKTFSLFPPSWIEWYIPSPLPFFHRFGPHFCSSFDSCLSHFLIPLFWWCKVRILFSLHFFVSRLAGKEVCTQVEVDFPSTSGPDFLVFFSLTLPRFYHILLPFLLLSILIFIIHDVGSIPANETLPLPPCFLVFLFHSSSFLLPPLLHRFHLKWSFEGI